MRAVVCDQPGDADVLRIEQVPDPVPRDGEILIRVAAAGVNRADILQRRGFYPPPPGASDVLGLEVSGVVDAVAAGVRGWAPGERVMALIEGGGYAELAAARAAQTVRLPAEVDLVEAGGVPEVFITAHDNLFTRARLQPGETVLIHGGAGGVGSAAVQLSKRHGCRVLVTAGSDEKLRRCADLGADIGIKYTDDDFVARTLDGTDGHGADVILDVMGASYLERNLEALAQDGRIVIIAMQGGTAGEMNLGQLSRKRGTLTATHLRGRPPQQKAAIVSAFDRDVVPGVGDGSLRPVIDRVLPLDAVQDAHRLLESGTVVGKVVLQVVAG